MHRDSPGDLKGATDNSVLIEVVVIDYNTIMRTSSEYLISLHCSNSAAHHIVRLPQIYSTYSHDQGRRTKPACKASYNLGLWKKQVRFHTDCFCFLRPIMW